MWPPTPFPLPLWCEPTLRAPAPPATPAQVHRDQLLGVRRQGPSPSLGHSLKVNPHHGPLLRYSGSSPEPLAREIHAMTLLLLVAALCVDVAHAESPPPGTPTATTEADAKDAVLPQAIDLPATAQALRDAGVPDKDVSDALAAARDKGLTAADTQGMLAAAEADVDEHGPVDNFGAFVQTQLEAGLRGQDLAAAIHEEHAARGKGKSNAKSEENGEAGDHGNNPDRGASADKGRPSDKGRSAEGDSEKGKGSKAAGAAAGKSNGKGGK